MGQLAQMIGAPTIAMSGEDAAQAVGSVVKTSGKRWQLITTVLCEDIANSSADNAPTIYKIFLAVTAHRLPFSQRLTTVTFWLFEEPGTYVISVQVLTPEGEPWLKGESEADVENPGTYLTTSIHFGTVEFPTHGRYRAEILLNGEAAGAYPLFIQPPPAQMEAQGEG
jgi:hypothetical protein